MRRLPRDPRRRDADLPLNVVVGIIVVLSAILVGALASALIYG